MGGCSTTAGIDSVPLHGWPKDEEAARQWITFLRTTRQDNFTLNRQHSQVCCLHFEVDKFVNVMSWRNGYGKLQLQPQAVPTIKDPAHNQLGLDCPSNGRMGKLIML